MNMKTFVLVCVVSLIVIFMFQITLRSFTVPYKELVRPQIKTVNPIQKVIIIPNKTQEVKKVLFYTTWFGNPRWLSAEINQTTMLFEYPESHLPCEYKCRLTYNRDELVSSHAVIFHNRDFPGNIWQISRNRTQKQRWVYLTHENPYNWPHDPAKFNGLFNWTWTYRGDSDVFYPYETYRVLGKDETPKNHITINFAKHKTNLIAWASSNCNSHGKRDQVVAKLTSFLPISIHGRCMHHFPRRSNKDSCGAYGNDKCIKLYKSTKFYLAFENAICPDYITEKYWNTPFGNDMVPIVMGPDYYSKLAIPGSYINLFDFSSPKAFAEYINYLDKNDTAYNEYFQWKTKYKVCHSTSFCQICEKLHNDSLPIKVYHHLDTYWGTKDCEKNLEKLKKYI